MRKDSDGSPPTMTIFFSLYISRDYISKLKKTTLLNVSLKTFQRINP